MPEGTLKSPCDRGYIPHITRNYELLAKSKAKKSARKGEKQNKICSSKSAVDQKIKRQSKINKTALFRDNRNNTIQKISSNVIYTRRFSRYNDVQRKLKGNKFKSTYENSGKYDESSVKYKSYVNSNENNKKKLLMKYSMCNGLNSNNKPIKNKRTGFCSDLPGKGTYNHRFAYDQALKLRAQGVDVDVLYKVKNSSDSVYVVNGAFARTDYKRPPTSRYLDALDTSTTARQQNTACSQKKTNTNELNKSKNTKDASKDEDEEALWLKQLAKRREIEEEKKKRLSTLADMKKAKHDKEKRLKREELIRQQKLREAERDLRAKQLDKILNNQVMDRKNKKLDAKLSADEKRRMMDEQMERDRLKSLDEENKKLMREKMKHCLAMKFQKNKMNITRSKLEFNPTKSYGESEVITDINKLDAIEKWALQCDGTSRNMSWLKTVTCRIDSLGGRVNKSCKNKWMRNALDSVVNNMTEEQTLSNCSSSSLQICSQKSPCDKKMKACSSLVIKTRRMTQCPPCHHNNKQTTALCMQKSRKFSVCPAINTCTEAITRRGNNNDELCKMTKTVKGGCFQVSNVDARGPPQCFKDRCAEC